jgi:hypothetical protein
MIVSFFMGDSPLCICIGAILTIDKDADKFYFAIVFPVINQFGILEEDVIYISRDGMTFLSRYARPEKIR